MSTEQQLARYILGDTEASVLMTDAYKFSMAQAGFPLRPETFYLCFRRGDPQLIAFDIEQVIKAFLPNLNNLDMKQRGFLQSYGYGLTPAMEQALRGDVDIWCAPKSSWVLPGEPLATITGPSFLVSWFEPLILMLNFAIQLSSLRPGSYMASCESELNIYKLLCGNEGFDIENDEIEYRANVRRNASAIKEAINRPQLLPYQNQMYRTFEVGMRAATCMEQHRIALEECKNVNIERSSNVHSAYKLNLYPVGTTGHEHQLRWGADENGFRAIRDMRPEMPSYLFDTYNPVEIGIPAALKVMREDPDRQCSMRFDSGDQDHQFKLIGAAKELKPILIFEDGYNAKKTAANEKFLDSFLFPWDRAWYGYGGYLVSQPGLTDLTRDRVSAAYKLSQTGDKPVMKFSGSPGKESIPGKPVIFRRVAYKQLPDPDYPPNCISMIGQADEDPPNYFKPIEALTQEERFWWSNQWGCHKNAKTAFSPATAELIRQCTDRRDELLKETS